jgi:lipopolysaccharide export system protein LptA
VEVRSRSHELRTNHAVFKDEVVLTVLQDGQNRGSIAADQMDVYFVGTNELTRVEAAGNVVMVREETRFTAGRAVYTAATGRALLTDNPLWTHGRRSGGGWEMEFDVAANQLRVNRDAWMRLPAEELVAYEPQLGRPGGNLPKGLEKGMGDLTGLAEITADSYSFSPVKGEFAGNVRVQHPRMWWTSGDIRIDFPKQAGRADRLLARQGVVFEVTDSRGQVLRGVGDQVSYVYGTVPGATNEFMELSGLPARLSTTNSTAVNNRFVVDLVRHTITASGRYAITGTTNASSLPALPSTDQFKLPETRRKR